MIVMITLPGIQQLFIKPFMMLLSLINDAVPIAACRMDEVVMPVKFRKG
jgi:hypothetical protein